MKKPKKTTGGKGATSSASTSSGKEHGGGDKDKDKDGGGGLCVLCGAAPACAECKGLQKAVEDLKRHWTEHLEDADDERKARYRTPLFK